MLLGDSLAALASGAHARQLIGADALAVAMGWASGQGAQRTLGFAAVNALTRHVFDRVGFKPPDATDSIGGLGPQAGEHIGMIGFFPPLVKQVTACGARLTVLELRPELAGDHAGDSGNFRVTLVAQRRLTDRKRGAQHASPAAAGAPHHVQCLTRVSALVQVDAELSASVRCGTGQRMPSMLRNRLLLVAAELVSAAAFAQVVPLPDPSRGELLYATHCIACHTSQIHWLDARLASDWASLRALVRRWQAEAGLSWCVSTTRSKTEICRHDEQGEVDGGACTTALTLRKSRHSTWAQLCLRACGANRSDHGVTTMHQTVGLGPLALPGDLTLPAGAAGLVVFAHGSGSSHRSGRNRAVAQGLQQCRIGTFDLLTPQEAQSRENVFDIDLLAQRLLQALDWVRGLPAAQALPLGLFGASTGAAAALVAGAQRPREVAALVSRGGRPDLAGPVLGDVRSPTLLIVGGADDQVLQLNLAALGKVCKSPEQV